MKSTTGDRAHRITAVVIGLLILLGYVAYGPATAVMTSMLEAPNGLSEVAANAVLFGVLALSMLVNSAAVVGIGVLMYRVVKAHHDGVALAYVGTRIFEAIVLAVGIVFLLLQVPLAQEAAESGVGGESVQLMSAVATRANAIAYQIAMLGLGVGSVPLWGLIYRLRLVPRPLAALGVVGYAVFAAGAALELLGLEVGLLLSIPGGLFELAVAIWLIARGFSSPMTAAGAALAKGVHPARPSTTPAS